MFLTVGQNWHMPGLDFWPGLNLLLMLGTASDDAQSGISSMEPVAWQKYTTGTLLECLAAILVFFVFDYKQVFSKDSILDHCKWPRIANIAEEGKPLF